MLNRGDDMHTTPPLKGFLRLKQIIGDRHASPPIPAIIPISASSWWAGVAEGRLPKPVKIGRNTTAWRWEDIEELVDHLADGSK
jgi:prophage regulatory protein